MEEKTKTHKLVESDFVILEMLYQYYYLTFEHIQYLLGVQKNQTYKRIKNLLDNEYMTKFLVGSKKNQTSQQIYTLARGGFFAVTDYYTQEKFNVESTQYLKKTYKHSLVIADLLFSYKRKKEEEGVAVEIFSEKQAYHFYGQEKDYKSVLRPDGAVVLNGNCMMIEYENQQKSRSIENKLKRYDYYVENRLIYQHPNIEAHPNLMLVFVYNTELKKEHAKVKIKEIKDRLNLTDKLKIQLTTIELFKS